MTFSFDFANGAQEWTSGFADYPAAQEAFLDLVADHRPLPTSLGARRSALYISGNNHSDDLFMFYKRRVTGLAAAARYEVRLEVEIATDVPTGCGGIGGSPGESVYVKAGAGPFEPLTSSDAAGQVRVIDFDYGNQAVSGRDALVLGNIANSQPCDVSSGDIVRQWELKTLRSPAAIVIGADAQGAGWLVVGTDSGFEGTTSLYYTRVVATFAPVA